MQKKLLMIAASYGHYQSVVLPEDVWQFALNYGADRLVSYLESRMDKVAASKVEMIGYELKRSDGEGIMLVALTDYNLSPVSLDDFQSLDLGIYQDQE